MIHDTVTVGLCRQDLLVCSFLEDVVLQSSNVQVPKKKKKHITRITSRACEKPPDLIRVSYLGGQDWNFFVNAPSRSCLEGEQGV